MGKLANIFLFIFVLMLSSCSDSTNSSDNANISDNQNNSENSNNPNNSNNSSNSNGSSDNPPSSSIVNIDGYTINTVGENGILKASVTPPLSTSGNGDKYLWYLGNYTEQDAENVKTDIYSVYNENIIDNKQGLSVELKASELTGSYGLIFVVLDSSDKVKISTYLPVTIQYKSNTDKAFLFTAEEGPDSSSGQNYMYFAIRVYGTSPSKKFRVDVAPRDAMDYDWAYPRHLLFQYNGNGYENFTGSKTDLVNTLGQTKLYDLCYDDNICLGGYSEATGFANEAGSQFEFPFYYGTDNFRVSKGSGTLEFPFPSIAVYDRTKYPTDIMIFNPETTIISVHGASLKIGIDMNKYNSNKHKNIALIDIFFENYTGGSELPIITHVGFVNKDGSLDLFSK